MPESASEPTLALFDAAHLRAQCWKALARAERGESQHFEIDHTALQACVQRLAISMQPAIERSAPPLHNCWYRLQERFGDDLDHLARTLSTADDRARARSGLDLALLTTLADPAGSDDERFLGAVQDFIAGEFMAAERGAPMLDAAGLQAWLEDPHEPPAIDSQAVTALKDSLEGHRELFGDSAQFGRLIDAIAGAGDSDAPRASDLFSRIGPLLLPVWPSPTRLGRLPAGDAWRAAGLFGQDALVSFQAPILRLIEAMVEPVSEAGWRLRGLDELPVAPTTKLMSALMTLDLVRPRHSSVTRLRHPAGSDIVVEFRCLTIALFDRLCDHLTKELKCATAHLPPQRTIVPLLDAAANTESELAFRVDTTLF